MKKAFLLFLALILSGCATYKFTKGQSPYDKGYVMARDNTNIAEYTVGKDNTVPSNIDLAQVRFERRKDTVEHYYKEIGTMQERLWTYMNYPAAMLKFIVGELSIPFIALADYRYNHDPKYKARLDRLDQERDDKEKARTDKLRKELSEYIQKDLQEEVLPPADLTASSTQAVVTQVAPPEEKPKIEEKPAAVEEKPATTEAAQPIAEEKPKAEEKPVTREEKPVIKEEVVPEAPQEEVPPAAQQKEEVPVSKETVAEEPKPEEKTTGISFPVEAAPPEAKTEEAAPEVKTLQPVSADIKAVITASPVKGLSPLRVRFSSAKSYSRAARIISYSWDFGDGDSSAKPSPVNTYYSVSFQPQYFTVTLTVRDNKGNTATTSTVIEVRNK